MVVQKGLHQRSRQFLCLYLVKLTPRRHELTARITVLPETTLQKTTKPVPAVHGKILDKPVGASTMADVRRRKTRKTYLKGLHLESFLGHFRSFACEIPADFSPEHAQHPNLQNPGGGDGVVLKRRQAIQRHCEF